MIKLYDDLINIINYEPDKNEEMLEEEICNKENKIFNILFWANIILLSFAIFCVLDEFPLGTLVFVLSIIFSIAIIRNYQIKHRARINVLINDECNFNKLLTVFMVRARHYVYITKRTYIVLSDIGNTLCYLGKFEEAKKTMDLIKKYCDTPMGNANRVSLYAVVARYEMDKEAIEYYTKELEKLMPQVNSPYITKLYDNISSYPLKMEVEEKGDYIKALELYKAYDKNSKLEKVSINYRLYKIAQVAGLKEEASKHRAYVLENGGDTFYKKELEGVN